MTELWIVNGRCEPCLHRKLDGDGDDMCDCWCHDLCPDCSDPGCTGEDCYRPGEDDLP